MARILLIDDDRDFSALLGDALESHGHQVESIDCAEPALARLTPDGDDIDVVLLDNRMPGMHGIDFLEELRRREVAVPVLLMTGHDTADVAIRASKLGAFKFFPKTDHLDQCLDRLLQLIRQAAGIARLRREPSLQSSADTEETNGVLLLGRSEAMCEVYEWIGSAALHDDPVLISGETGTGKELTAQTLRSHSERRDGPFIKVSCAAFTEQRLEEELFGHESADHAGVFERAAGGTVLLDDVDATSRVIQAKLLRVLQEGVVVRAGRRGPAMDVNVRILASTSHDLQGDIEQGRFDAELFYLLQRVSIHLPPLRRRGQDVQLLADHFLLRTSVASRRAVRSFEDPVREMFSRHPWPGNVRELQTVVRRAVHACRGARIGPDDLRLTPPALDPSGEVCSFIRQAIRAGLHAGQPDGASFLRSVFERELALAAGEETAEKRLPPSRQKAYQLFQWALEQHPDLADVSDAEVFRWLQDDPRVAGEGLPDRAETFERYLRDARAYHHDRKNTPRSGRPCGSSIVPASRL